VTLKVNLKGYQGSVKKNATVMSNDPQNPRAMLVLQGTVKALIELQPANNISFRGMADQQTEKSVDLISTRQPFVIQKVESNLEDKIRYQMETVEQGKHYRLKVTNLLKQGNYSGSIKCYTDVPEKSEVIVRVTGYIEGEISVKPLVVLVGKLATQQPARSGKVLVVSNRNKPFQIKKLTYDEKLIEVKQEPLPNESGFSLEITPRMENLSRGPSNRQQTTLTITTDVQSDVPQQVQVHIINTPDAAPAPGPAGSANPPAPSQPEQAQKGTPE
jgi:hypothetical protein